MNRFKHSMGQISRDLLALHGHLLPLQGWDGTAPHAAPAKPGTSSAGGAGGAAPGHWKQALNTVHRDLLLMNGHLADWPAPAPCPPPVVPARTSAICCA